MSPFNAFRKDVTVKRYADGAYVNGVWVEGAETTLTVKASVQPATTEDLQSLPENRRQLGAYRIYTDSELKSVVENANNPDKVVIDSTDYEVAQVQPWKNGLIEHYKALAVRVQPT